jgi:hypothetical protein
MRKPDWDEIPSVRWDACQKPSCQCAFRAAENWVANQHQK